MSHSERHTALAWADQIDTQRRAAAHPHIPGATALQLAIVQHMTHPAAALADCGTESLCDQMLQHAGPIDPPAPTQEHAMPDGFAHLPAALTQPGELPPPIPFPARPPNARTTEPSESTRRRWARMAETEAAARQAAHADGVREGWRGGWRWGLWQGMAIGVLLASIGWALWLTATAPQAAPPSASPTESTPLTRRG